VRALACAGQVQRQQGGQHDHPIHRAAGHAGQGHQHVCDARARVVLMALPRACAHRERQLPVHARGAADQGARPADLVAAAAGAGVDKGMGDAGDVAHACGIMDACILCNPFAAVCKQGISAACAPL